MAKLTNKGSVSKMGLLDLVKKHCTWCCGGSYSDRQACATYDCALWPHRNGNTFPEKRQKVETPMKIVDGEENTLRTSWDEFPETRPKSGSLERKTGS